ncbi:hypothetical protein [Spirulina sp. 06S082]|nr:hypothetical protein [Spirulina sp. 06S082]MEA5468897.1 hypothetical protein [Spirulina sp. 06S082]
MGCGVRDRAIAVLPKSALELKAKKVRSSDRTLQANDYALTKITV